MRSSPGHQPNAITSCEYASRVTGSASGDRRRPPARVARVREVEAVPEQVRRARLADEAASGTPRARRRSGAGSSRTARPRRRRSCRASVSSGNAGLSPRSNGCGVDLARRRRRRPARRTGPRRSARTRAGRAARSPPSRPSLARTAQPVVDEVELDLDGPVAVRHRPGRQPARGHVQRHVPPVVARAAPAPCAPCRRSARSDAASASSAPSPRTGARPARLDSAAMPTAAGTCAGSMWCAASDSWYSTSSPPAVSRSRARRAKSISMTGSLRPCAMNARTSLAAGELRAASRRRPG